MSQHPRGPTLADPAVQSCPYAAYDEMRESGPVYRDPVTGYFVVTRYEDIRRVAAQPELFSNMTGLLRGHQSEVAAEVAEIILNEGWYPPPTLVDNDPPSHAEYRALVDAAFRPARIQAIGGYIESVAGELIDAFADRGETEFTSSFAIPLPITVIADQLGVGRERLADFKRWSDGVMEAAEINTPPARQIELAHVLVEMQRFFAERLTRARENPRDDIISDLAVAEIGGQPIEMSAMQSIMLQLLVAGNETTTNAIGSAMLKLIETGLENRLRAEPELVSPFVEEALRLEAPLQNLFRRATADTELGGVAIPEGSFLVLSWGAGNRDSRRFAKPGELDLARAGAARQHLTFGYGVHYCVGNALARAELKIGFRLLLERLRTFRLVEGEAVEYQPHIIARGPKRLRIRFERRF